MLRGYQQRQNFGHGGGIDPSVGSLLGQDGAAVHVNHHGIAAVDGIVQGHSGAVGLHGVGTLRFRSLVDGLYGGNGFFRLNGRGFRFLLQSPGGQQHHRGQGQSARGHELTQHPAPALQLLFSPDGSPLGPPCPALFFADDGRIRFVHSMLLKTENLC